MINCTRKYSYWIALWDKLRYKTVDYPPELDCNFYWCEQSPRSWYKMMLYSKNNILKRLKGRKKKHDRTYEDFYKLLAKSPRLGKVEPLSHFLNKYHDSSK